MKIEMGESTIAFLNYMDFENKQGAFGGFYKSIDMLENLN
jgi:hypothetical protein